MDCFELEDLEAIRIALVLAGLLGAVDLAIGHLSGSLVVLPCAVCAILIKIHQENKIRQMARATSRDEAHRK